MIFDLPIVNEETGECECPCIFSSGHCDITFQYTNSNAIQDDGFDFYIIPPKGPERFVGNIDAKCKSYEDPPCDCAAVDVFSFTTRIYQSDLDPCEPCTIQWRSELVQDNGCGTLGFFEIIGPYGDVPDAGEIGGSGSIDLRSVCISE
jgi:hypothetical protein